MDTNLTTCDLSCRFNLDSAAIFRKRIQIGMDPRQAARDRNSEISDSVIRAAQIEAALGTLQLAAARFQPCRAVWTVLGRIGLCSRCTPPIHGRRRSFLLAHRFAFCPTPMPERPGDGPAGYAARSLAVTVVRLQHSAMTNQAPSLFQTFTYFPCCSVAAPPGLRTIRVNLPISIAISTE